MRAPPKPSKSALRGSVLAHLQGTPFSRMTSAPVLPQFLLLAGTAVVTCAPALWSYGGITGTALIVRKPQHTVQHILRNVHTCAGCGRVSRTPLTVLSGITLSSALYHLLAFMCGAVSC